MIQFPIRVALALFLCCICFFSANAQAKMPAGIPHFSKYQGVTTEALQAKKTAFIRSYPALSKQIASDNALAAEYGITEADCTAALPLAISEPQAITLAKAEVSQTELRAMSDLQQAEVRANSARFHILEK